MRRSLRGWVRPKLWVPLVLGLGGFVAWAGLVWLRMRGEGGAVDTTGMKEVSGYMGGSGLARYGKAVVTGLLSPTSALPATLLAVPVVIGLRRGVWDDARKRLLVGVLLAFAAGAVVSVLAVLRQPRYYNPVLVSAPMLAAAVAGAWGKAVFGERGRAAVRAGMTVYSLVLGIGAVVLASSAGTDQRATPGWAWVTAGLAAAGAAWALVELLQHRAGWGLVGTTAALLAVMSTFGARWSADKHERGVWETAAELRSRVEGAPAVYATKTVFDHPSMYHYAGFSPTPLPTGWVRMSETLEPGAWCVLQDYEWEALAAADTSLDEEAEGGGVVRLVLDGDTMWMVRVPGSRRLD